jgi:hypothetical protein
MAQDECFEKFNVIYGSNGSGKSTLASLLSTLADGDWSSRTTLKVRDEDTQQDRNISDTDSTLTNSLCVFNEDYILKNLRFDKGETESLLYLGKESIDNQNQREKLEKAIEESAQLIPKLEQEHRKLDNKCNKIATDGANKVTDKLQGVNGRQYNKRKFQRPQFEEALKSLSPERDLTNFDVDQQIRRIISPADKKIDELTDLRIPLADITARVSNILTQTVTSEAIEELKNNHEAAAWVQAGMQLHHVGDRCLFCEGVYTEERIGRLSRHFDKSLRRVQQTIETLDTQLIGYEQQCEQFVNNLEAPNPLDEVRTKHWLSCINTMRGPIDAVKERLTFLRQQLARKQKELFQSLSFDELSTDGTASGNVDVEDLNAIIRKHNNDIDNYDNLKKQVCRDVVQYYVEQVRKDYDASKEAVQKAESDLKSAKEGLENNKAELQLLQNSQQDRTHFAKLLTTDLHHYFGRDELTLELTGDAYSILRNGETAKHLSEGERRSIALLYFLRDIDSNGAKLSKRIVVIDDPVSSIDDSSALSAFTYIYKKCITTFDIQNTKNKDKNIGQLFILTHNFDFFRRWVNIFIKDNNIRKCTTIRELRVNNVTTSSNITLRTPRFIDWSMAKKYSLLRSEYHYLFWRAATELMCWKYSSSSNVMDYYDIAIIPNVCRRLLEGFLSFHHPQDVGNFTKQMEHVVDQLSNNTTRTYMVNFLHNYSHNEQCDLTKPIDIYESSKVIEHVFNTIYLLDENHYRAMCKAFDIEESKLLPSWRKIS